MGWKFCAINRLLALFFFSLDTLIEGAFMQGVGLFTMEDELYNTKGQLLTRGPGAYKIPGFRDIPRKP